MREVLIVFFALITISAAFALPGIENADFTRNNTRIEELVTNTSTEYLIDFVREQPLPIRPLNREGAVRAVNGWHFWTLEADPYIGQKITVIDFETLQLTSTENPARHYPLPDAPLTICVNGTTLIGQDRFRVRSSPYCNADNIYSLPRLAFDTPRTLSFASHPTPFEWWLGGDELTGITPQGGGGDLLVCEFMTTRITAPGNVTVGVPFSYGIQGLDDGEVGCSIVWLRRQSNTTSPITFALIPPNSTGINMNCTGVSCQETAPPNDVWQYTNVTCEKEGDQFIRGRMRYSTLSSTQNTNSLQQTVTCNPPISGDAGEEFVIFYLWLLLAMIVITKLLFVMKNKKDKKNAKSED